MKRDVPDPSVASYVHAWDVVTSDQHHAVVMDDAYELDSAIQHIRLISTTAAVNCHRTTISEN